MLHDVLRRAVEASLDSHRLYLDLFFDSLSQSVGEFDRKDVLALEWGVSELGLAKGQMPPILVVGARATEAPFSRVDLIPFSRPLRLDFVFSV